MVFEPMNGLADQDAERQIQAKSTSSVKDTAEDVSDSSAVHSASAANTSRFRLGKPIYIIFHLLIF
jgi:hypothetical protein